MDWLPDLPQDHPWAKFIREASQGGTYGDVGQWSLLRATMTGEWRQAVERNLQALEEQTRYLVESRDRNHTREHGIYFGWAASQLAPHTTDAERLQFERLLAIWRDFMLANTRLGDQDENAGHLFAMLLIAEFLGEDAYQYDFGGGFTLGTLLHQVLTDIHTGQGGVGLEGSTYDLGTGQLILLGALLVGKEQFPEIVAWAKARAELVAWMLTSDRRSMVHYGDGAEPHIRWDRLYPLLALCAAVGDSQVAMDLLSELGVNLGTGPHSSWRTAAAIDPRKLPENPPFHNPRGLYTTGIGLCIWRSGDWIVAVHQPTVPPGADHEPQYGVASVTVWDGEKWVLPLGSIGAYIFPVDAHNTARAVFPYNGEGIYYGFRDRGIESVEATSAGFRLVGYQGGIHRTWGFAPIPFLDKHRRIVEWDDAAKMLRVCDEAVYLKQPPRGDPAADLYLYSSELAALQTPWLLEQIWQDGEYELVNNLVERIPESGRQRLVSDDFPSPVIDSLAKFVDSLSPAPQPPPPEPDPDPEPDPIHGKLDTIIARLESLQSDSARREELEAALDAVRAAVKLAGR